MSSKPRFLAARLGQSIELEEYNFQVADEALQDTQTTVGVLVREHWGPGGERG